MALPKELTAALDAWKKGEGEFPEALNHGSFFENDGVLQKVINGKLGPAQKAARAEAEAQILELVGVNDPEQLKEIKQKLAEAAGTVTEVEKLRSTNTKWEKEHAKANERIKELEGFKVKVLKAQAIEPHLAKVHPDFRALVRENLEGKLRIDGEKVLAPEDADVGSFLDGMLKATPSLKAPDFQAGAGTGPSGGKSKQGAAATTGNGAAAAAGAGGQPNGVVQPQDFGSLFSTVMKEKAGEGSTQ
jgi:TolA-binding protein